MLQKKHGIQENGWEILISFRNKVNLQENKKNIELLRNRIINDAITGSLQTRHLRSSGKYSLKKLQHIRKYIWSYSMIVSNNFPEFNYLETHSGPGLCKIRGTNKIECGTPILALSNQPPFTKYRFIENNQICIKSLKELQNRYFSDYDLKIITGDSNIILNETLKDFNINYPILTIIDPEGMEIHWKTMEILSRYRTDIVMMFPYDLAIKRCVSPNCDKKSQDSVTKMYGTKKWISIRDEHYIHKKINYNHMRKEFVRSYKNRLINVLNFPHVVISRIIKGDNNQPLYYLFIAGRKNVTELIGKDILDVKTEQISLKLT